MTDTTDQLAAALIKGGMWIDHDVIADDEDGDTDVLRLNPPEGMLKEDDLGVFEKDVGVGTEWEYVTPGYGAIRRTQIGRGSWRARG